MAARYLAITKSGNRKQRYRRRTIGRNVSTGPVTLGVFIVLMIASLGVVYLVQSNSVSTSGYAIRDLEKRIESLEQDNQDLRLEAAELQSLKNLEEAQKDLGMVPNSEVLYVGGDSKLASSR